MPGSMSKLNSSSLPIQDTCRRSQGFCTIIYKTTVPWTVVIVVVQDKWPLVLYVLTVLRLMQPCCSSRAPEKSVLPPQLLENIENQHFQFQILSFFFHSMHKCQAGTFSGPPTPTPKFLPFIFLDGEENSMHEVFQIHGTKNRIFLPKNTLVVNFFFVDLWLYQLTFLSSTAGPESSVFSISELWAINIHARSFFSLKWGLSLAYALQLSVV